MKKNYLEPNTGHMFFVDREIWKIFIPEKT